jgi:hypothetical protein
MIPATSVLRPKYEYQGNINDFWPCILDNQGTVSLHQSIIELSAAFPAKNAFNDIVTVLQKLVSKILGHASLKSGGCVATLINN